MDHFTPLMSLFGGALIGSAAVALMLLNGRIAGVSGIAGNLLSFSTPATERGWRTAFVIGLLIGPLALVLFGGNRPDITFVASLPVLLVAGFLVGFGTIMGNGCTSGHGVCGIARLSRRSIVATGLFMAIAMTTTFVARHLL